MTLRGGNRVSRLLLEEADKEVEVGCLREAEGQRTTFARAVNCGAGCRGKGVRRSFQEPERFIMCQRGAREVELR